MSNTPPCLFFFNIRNASKGKGCAKGKECRFSHNSEHQHKEKPKASKAPAAAPVASTSAAASTSVTSQKKKPCIDFSKTGLCRFGSTCRFLHDKSILCVYVPYFMRIATQFLDKFGECLIGIVKNKICGCHGNHNLSGLMIDLKKQPFGVEICYDHFLLETSLDKCKCRGKRWHLPYPTYVAFKSYLRGTMDEDDRSLMIHGLALKFQMGKATSAEGVNTVPNSNAPTPKPEPLDEGYDEVGNGTLVELESSAAAAAASTVQHGSSCTCKECNTDAEF
jgi:hypothetical protein